MAVPISIIMTVYNRERYLSTAIESVLGQTKTDFELLILDDGSEDRSPDIAQDYAKCDQRVRVIKAKHLGRGPALKAAHEQTKGLYIGWVDSDDILAPTALEETAAILDNNSNVGLVYTDYVVIDSNGKIKGLGQRCRIPYSKERLLLDFMTFHFRLFRRSVFEQAGGIDESFQCALDYDLCLRLSEITRVQHLDKALYYYRKHNHNVSTEQRIEQISCSREAINRALKRRGLANRFELDVQIIGKFSLRQKQSSHQ